MGTSTSYVLSKKKNVTQGQINVKLRGCLLVTQSVERATPGLEIVGSIPAPYR